MKLDGEEKLKPKYDHLKRDPRFSGADKCCLWELVIFFSFNFLQKKKY